MATTIGQRQTVVAWWIFYALDCKAPGGAEVPDIAKWIEEAESDLAETDRILAAEYEEYTPQF